MGAPYQNSSENRPDKPDSLSGSAGIPGVGQWGPLDQVNSQTAFWNKIPRLLNHFRYRMQTENRDDVLDYEPIHLSVNPCEVYPVTSVPVKKHENAGLSLRQAPLIDFKLDNFRFLLEQVPTVRTIEFSAHTDPFRNADLLKMVNIAYKSIGAESTIITPGFMLNLFIENILASRLHTLAVRMYGHRPSLYSMFSGLPPQRFLTVRDNIQQLLERKKRLKSPVLIEASMTVDLHHFRLMPEMISFAEEMGLDGLRFENYVNPETGEFSDRTLFQDQQPVIRFIEELKQELAEKTSLNITWPVLMTRDMASHRACLDPFTTVAVDAEFNVSGCSRHRIHHPGMSKAWDADFWNNESYQWLRAIHQTNSTQTVPIACQTCPRNIPLSK